MEISAAKISKASYFKLNLIAFSLGFFFFFLGCGIAAMFGADTVKWNGEPVIGVRGLIYSLISWPIFSLLLTCFMWLFGVIGLWLYSLISPLQLTFKGQSSVTEDSNV